MSYMSAISIGLTATHMRTINCVIYTGTRSNLLRKDLVKPDCLPMMRLSDNHRLKCATSQNVEVIGTIVLYVRTGDSRVRMMFGIVRDMAVSALFGTSAVDKCSKDVIPTDWNIVRFNSPPVPILLVLWANNGTTYGNYRQYSHVTRTRT